MPPFGDSTSCILQTEGVGVRFGGLVALEDADLTVQRGKVTALIGPNGAGKSTLLNVISGFQEPTSGDVRLRGESIMGRKPYDVERLGLARTFQDVEVFGKLTVVENILLALPDQASDSLVRVLLQPGRCRRERRDGLAEVHRIMSRLGLEPYADELAENLSYGLQKDVVLGRLLATGAELLMFDEPGAGLPRAAIRDLGALLRRAVAEEGKTVLLVDHNMDLVLDFADFVYVLHAGRIVVHGTPDEIRASTLVADIYLSREHVTTADTVAAGGPQPAADEEANR